MTAESTRSYVEFKQNKIIILDYLAMPSEAKIIAHHFGGSVPSISEYFRALENQEGFRDAALGLALTARDKRGFGFSGRGEVQGYDVIKCRGDWELLPPEHRVDVDSSWGNQVSIGVYEDRLQIYVDYSFLEPLRSVQSVAVIGQSDAEQEISRVGRIREIESNRSWRRMDARVYDRILLPIERTWNKDAMPKEERDNVLAIENKELQKEFKLLRRDEVLEYIVSLLPSAERRIKRAYNIDVSDETRKIFKTKLVFNPYVTVPMPPMQPVQVTMAIPRTSEDSLAAADRIRDAIIASLERT